MTQIWWDSQTDGQRGKEAMRQAGTLQRAEANCIWTPPHACSPRGRALQYSGLSLPNPAQKTTRPSPGFAWFYSLWTDLHLLRTYVDMQCWFRTACVCIPESTRVHVSHVCVCAVRKHQHTPWNIKRWRWRCPCAGIGSGRVVILSRAMSCGNGCRAHPLITTMFNPPHHHSCFPTEQMTFMPETISPPDCRRGVFSGCRAWTKQL